MPRSSLKVTCDSTCHIPDANIPGRLIKGHSACGVLFVDEMDQVISTHSSYLGEVTPPQAEYMGLIFAMEEAAKICRGNLEIWMDSEFVIRQLNGDYGIKSENMKPLYDKVKSLEKRFLGVVHYYHHPRTAPLAIKADALAEGEYKRHRPK